MAAITGIAEITSFELHRERTGLQDSRRLDRLVGSVQPDRIGDSVWHKDAQYIFSEKRLARKGDAQSERRCGEKRRSPTPSWMGIRSGGFKLSGSFTIKIRLTTIPQFKPGPQT